MSQEIGASHGIEAGIARQHGLSCSLVATGIEGTRLAIAIGFILGIKQVVNRATQCECLDATQLEGVACI